jgi:hypothetical protein
MMMILKVCVDKEEEEDEVSTCLPFITDLTITQDNSLEKAVKLADTQKHTRSAGTGTMGVEHCNICCISVGEGMSLMANLMNSTADTLANTMHKVAMTLCLAEVAVTPWHVSAETNPNIPIAIEFIKSYEGLSDDKFSDAAQCITNNLTIATIYTSMSNPAACSRYIRKQVNRYQGQDWGMDAL